MIQVSIEDAYDEACRALGETVIRERLLSRRVVELEQLAVAGDSDSPTGGDRHA